MLKIVEFIKSHSDWRERLVEIPYFLRIKERGDLVMFNYTHGVSRPSEIVNEARGLILERDTWTVVRYGLYRFYNLGEEGTAQLDSNSMFATEKIDGSLIMAYYYHGGWFWSTRSTFMASEADAGESGNNFQWVLDKAHCHDLEKDFDPDVTYVFELVSPYTQVIIPYKTTELYFLMARNNKTLEEVEGNSDWLRPKTIPITSLEQIQKYVSQFEGKDFEGVVVQDKFHNRVKVKNLNWLKLHKMFNNGRLTIENVLELIRTGEYLEFLAYFPDKKSYFDRVLDWYQEVYAFATMQDECDYKTKYPNKKNFALWVNAVVEPRYRALYFKAYDGKAVEWLNTLTSVQFTRMFGEIYNESTKN